MDTVKDNGSKSWRWVRPLGWGGAAALVLLPLVMMKFVPAAGFNWTVSDFLFAAFMLGGVGLALELAVRISKSSSYRIGAGLGLAAGLLLVWVTGAVGYIGSEENPFNLLFLGVVALAFAGSLIAAFRPMGMALAMAAAGIAHGVIGVIGAAQEPRTLLITIVFLGLWFGSARLFQLSEREAAPTA